MRKQYKVKKCSCGLCKPHKKGISVRWKPKVLNDLKEGLKEINEERNYKKES